MTGRRHLIRALVAVTAIAGLALAWNMERRSVERANRLFRAGDAMTAEAIYAAHKVGDASPELSYNLGTALIDQRAAEGELELELGTRSRDRDVRGRAQYNAGLSRLERAMDAEQPDSVRFHAAVAVDANRAALRLRPEDDNAKWNLAMSLRLLDSIDAIQRRSGRELMDGAVEADVVTRSVNVPDAAEDEFAEDPPAEGEDETVAVVGDESPLSLEDAASILSRSHLDATQILAKLIALESRTRWGRQLRRGVRRW